MSKSEGHGDGCVCYSCIDDAEDTPESEREYYDTREGWEDARCEHCGEPFWSYERDEACDECKDWRPDA